jgi:hypothetical protein
LGTVATVAVVAIGPGGLALGANPNDSTHRGARGANSNGSPAGADGRDAIDRGNGRGPDGHKGKQGQDGPAGPEIDGGRGARANIDIRVPLGGRRGTKGLQKRINRQVRDALAAQGIQQP